MHEQRRSYFRNNFPFAQAGYLIFAVLLLAVVSQLFACTKDKAADEPAAVVSTDRPNVVFILIDALRKDHVGAYGYDRNTTPVIDSLAEKGILFENAYSQASFTMASMYSMLTSNYPSQLSRGALESIIDDLGKPAEKLSEEAVTLAEVLNESGYQTACISANRVMSDTFGLWQGYEHTSLRFTYQGYVNQKADVLVDEAIELLDTELLPTKEDPRPFFMHVHIMEVHSPTNPPEPYFSMFSGIDGKPNEEIHESWMFEDGIGLDTPEFKAFRSHKLALYDGSLVFADEQVGRLLDYLEKRGALENTIVVIAADHGEEFWEHAEVAKDRMSEYINRFGVAHGRSLFGEALEVPLIFSGKGIPHMRVTERVRNLDIMPTILGATATDTSGLKMMGVDLLGMIKRGELKDLPVLSDGLSSKGTRRALLEGDYKYIRFVGEEFLFDKKNDPKETRDISRERPDIVMDMRKRIRDFDTVLLFNPGEEVKLDEDAVKELKALGYLQ